MESEVKHIPKDVEELNEAAKKGLAAAHRTPDSEYIRHNELKKRVLKSSYRQSA